MLKTFVRNNVFWSHQNCRQDKVVFIFWLKSAGVVIKMKFTEYQLCQSALTFGSTKARFMFFWIKGKGPSQATPACFVQVSLEKLVEYISAREA